MGNYFGKINVLIKDEAWSFCQMKYIESKGGKSNKFIEKVV